MMSTRHTDLEFCDCRRCRKQKETRKKDSRQKLHSDLLSKAARRVFLASGPHLGGNPTKIQGLNPRE